MALAKKGQQQVASEILTQLGGNKFIVMTGSKQFVALEKGLGMKLTRNQTGANYLRITLTSMDDYIMEFISIRGASMKVKALIEGVYCDTLQEVFTERTGLYTSL